MKRSGFKQKQIERNRTVHTKIPEHLRRSATYAKSSMEESIPKQELFRSEDYRRLVAALPCANCGAVGRSQAAHINEGKGMGMKASDEWTFPLCADAPLFQGCHSAYDQYKLLATDKHGHAQQGVIWANETQQKLGVRFVHR